MGSKAFNSKKTNDKATKTAKVKENKFKKSTPNDPDVLVNLPAGRLTNTSGSLEVDFLNLLSLTLLVLIALSLVFLELEALEPIFLIRRISLSL